MSNLKSQSSKLLRIGNCLSAPLGILSLSKGKLEIGNSRVSERGFTLIEISIVISILAVLTTVGLASFVSYSRTQTIQTAAYDLRTTLNLAKSRSFSQVKPPECGLAPLDGYEVLVSQANSSYEMDTVCAGNVYKMLGGNFPQGITVSSDTTSTSFFFPVISGGVVGSGSVVLSGYGQTRTITVDSIGTVK